MKVPEVDLAGCDVLLWKEGEEIYVLEPDTGKISRVRSGKLGEFIENFPRELTMCIMNDQTGKPVRISPLAN